MSLREALYPKVEPIVTRIVSFLTSQGISPNQLTLAGAALSLLTGVIYAKGYFFLGGIMLIIAGACDLLDGPLAFDTAVSVKAAKIKGLVSPVTGQADILVVPDLESGNMLAKQLEYLGGAQLAGIVLGARVPTILTSRADSAETRLDRKSVV